MTNIYKLSSGECIGDLENKEKIKIKVLIMDADEGTALIYLPEQLEYYCNSEKNWIKEDKSPYQNSSIMIVRLSKSKKYWRKVKEIDESFINLNNKNDRRIRKLINAS